VPVVTPEIVVGISLLLLFGLLGVQLGLSTILIAHIAFNISFVVIVVRARLEGMDRSLEEASMMLGADEWTTFWRVTVPQLWPGILSGALLAFTMSFDDYVITSLVSGPGNSTLPVVVYTMVRKGVEPTINAISTLILLVTAALIWAAERFAQQDKRVIED
jgi:spermidine/putrescine transport system permease protein